MGLPIEKWARQATLLEPPSSRLLSDIGELAHFQRLFWRKQTKELIDAGGPIALQGGFAGMPVVPPSAVLATVASISGTVALWTSALYTPIAAGTVQAPQAYRIVANGTTTNTTSPANVGWDPRIGAGSTGGSAVAGTTMGASTNVAETASITLSFWTVMGDITIRSIGAAGANSVCIGWFQYIGTQATASGLAGPAVVGAGHNLMFGGSSASVDLSVAAGFSLGVVRTVTTVNYFVHGIHWSSWN